MEQSEFLTTQGTKLVDREGKTVILRGFGLGGWMNMENFITGYPANETAQRQVIYDVLGEEKYELFFERFDHCLVLFVLLHLAHRHQHDEERQQQRHHVAERDDPFRDARCGFFFNRHGKIPSLDDRRRRPL